jgi:DNA-binding transcriptional MerR regulator
MSATSPQYEIPIPRESLLTISEVSRLTDTKPFVLRFWEKEFPMLQPVKNDSGRRLYRREDVETVLRIKRLLYDEGFTIPGARRHLREQDAPAGIGSAPAAAPVEPLAAVQRKTLLDLRDALRAFLTLLEGE